MSLNTPKPWGPGKPARGQPGGPEAQGTLDVARRVFSSSSPIPSVWASTFSVPGQVRPGQTVGVPRSPGRTRGTGPRQVGGAQGAKERALRPPCALRVQGSAAGARLASPSALRPRFSPTGSRADLSPFAFWSPSVAPASPPYSSRRPLSPSVSGRLSDSSRVSLGASVSPDLPSRSWVSCRVFPVCLTTRPSHLSLCVP